MNAGAFSYPLNLFARAMELEEGAVRYLHHGIYEHEGQPIHEAQEHATRLTLAQLPAPPARILEVGIGLGTTGRLLQERGYEYVGITPDAAQIERCRESGLDLRCVKLEHLPPDGPAFDVILFQESAQYLDVEDILRKADELLAPGGAVVIADELRGELFRSLRSLLAGQPIVLEEARDVSAGAIPSFRYMLRILRTHLERLAAELALPREHIEGMILYTDHRLRKYERGDYVYALLRLRKAA